MKRLNIFNKKKEKDLNMENKQQNAHSDDELEQNNENETEDTGAEEVENSSNDQDSKIAEELSQMKDKYVRLVAEFDNFRKRTARERLELIKSANEDVLVSLLDVLDDVDRAEDQLKKSNDLEALREGVVLIFNKLRSSLKSQGLTAMESVNEDFNPDLHDAITEIPASSEDQVGKVMDEVKKGYYLNDKIVRHAKVVVGK